MKPEENVQLPPDTNEEKFETDAQKLVRRHLEDKNHTITEEELRSIKVGVDPIPDEDDVSEEQQ